MFLFEYIEEIRFRIIMNDDVGIFHCLEQIIISIDNLQNIWNRKNVH